MSATITTSSPTAVTQRHIDPVTGQYTTVKACCDASGVPHLHKSTTLLPSASTLIISAAAIGAVAAAAYAGYRYYQLHYGHRDSAGFGSATPTYPLVRVESPEDFDSTVADIVSKKSPSTRVYIVVVGERDPSTGRSWCPDCAEAEPVMHKAFTANAASIIVVEAPVSRQSYKNNPQHPYRTHPQLHLQRIPTIFRWENGRATGQLIENECKIYDNVNAFVSK